MIGISPTNLPPPLRPVPAPFAEHVAETVPNKERRLRAIASTWILDRYGDDRRPDRDDFQWDLHWYQVPYELLAQVFTFEELILLWFDSVISSKLNKYLEEHEALLWKIQNSLWRYGCEKDYNRFAACLSGLRRLHIDLPDFAVSVTHTRGCNTAAWSLHTQIDNTYGVYLDASFGLLIYYKGQHVMTVGFALSRYGILVAQVQLREKRGNRFLYKLPMPYLDFALDVLGRAFEGEALYLVTGESTAAAIRRAYGKDADKFATTTAARIERFYDQPLKCFVRTDETVRCGSDDGRAFVKLQSR